MLSKNKRLGAIGASQKTTQLYKGAFLNIRGTKNQLGRTRFSVVVSKKVAAGAVLRNRVRRFLYDRTKDVGSWDLLVGVNKPIMKLAPETKLELEKELDIALNQIK